MKKWMYTSIVSTMSVALSLLGCFVMATVFSAISLRPGGEFSGTTLVDGIMLVCAIAAGIALINYVFFRMNKDKFGLEEKWWRIPTTLSFIGSLLLAYVFVL